MEQKRLVLAIGLSLAILLVFQFVVAPLLPHPPAPHPAAVRAGNGATGKPASGPSASGPPASGPAVGAAAAAPRKVPRVPIAAPAVEGSLSLLGARLDDLVLRDYRQTIAPHSPLVRLLSPITSASPYYAEWGWSAAPGEKVALPGVDTRWTASGARLTPAHPLTLSWNNGAGLTFAITLTIDRDYLFGVTQSVTNHGTAAVTLYPWARIRRDGAPKVAGSYLLEEGPLGVMNGTLEQMTYTSARNKAKHHQGIAWTGTGKGGWIGITDKYWLAALVPDQASTHTAAFRTFARGTGTGFQTDLIATAAETIPPGGHAVSASHLFAGAKVVRLLDAYGAKYHIPSFDKAVDFGWFYFLTKPIFYALDWFNGLLGNFGLAIMAFTVVVRGLFFPLANKSYKSMSKMKLLAPKMQSVRERFKDDPARQQQEMLALYRTEKVNPASGCLPMLVQIPVFFALYKVLYVTIEMRHAPFIGWIHDLSAPDPTNLFNLFGLLPFHPGAITPFLHLGVWPLIMGGTMFLQQRLNPAPPDPVQARIFLFMPLIFTFMMAHFPVGLVIYYSWSNLLAIGQQWIIMRSTRLTKPSLARS